MQSGLRILLVEDAPTDAALIEQCLREAGLAFEARCVDTREAYERALKEFSPDLILADHTLPSFDAQRALRLARELAPLVPVIVVTGTLPDERAVDLLREGARDYILKDRLARLAPAVHRVLEETRCAAARVEAEEEFRLVFAEARDGIALIDRKTGQPVDCNPAFERQTGRSLEILRGTPVWDLRPPEKREAARALFEAVCAHGEGGAENLDYRRPDGSDSAVEIRSKLVALRGRQYVLTVSRDISERRAADGQLRAQLDELRQFQKAAVDRELRMKELRDENRRLREQLAARKGGT
ncbi:MAG: PAS domain S-box protein [Pseudomonadota bacterium]